MLKRIKKFFKGLCWHNWEHTHSFGKYEVLPGSKVYCETRAYACTKCNSHDYVIHVI